MYSGCGKENSVAVTGVTLNKNVITLSPNRTEILEATVWPANASNKTVTWKSNNEEVATVDPETGEVIAVDIGKAIITATTQDRNKKSTCTVNVSLAWWEDITYKLKNTAMPFERVDFDNPDNLYADVTGWTTTHPDAFCGVAHRNIQNRLYFFRWNEPGIPTSIENGKFYQTIELNAGTYKFSTAVFCNDISSGKFYSVANRGNNLPDTDDVEQESLGFYLIDELLGWDSNEIYTFEFVLSEKSNVTFGFVLSMEANSQSVISNVELFSFQ